MPQPDPANEKLRKLREWRNRPEPDLGMGFLKKQFKAEVERPYKQLASIIEIWRELVPAELVSHTRLDALNRGVLRVTVDSSPRLYELDRLLRGGLEQNIITSHRGQAFRKIQLHVGELGAGNASTAPRRRTDEQK